MDGGYDKCSCTRLRRFLIEAVVGPKVVESHSLMCNTFLSIAIVGGGVPHYVALYYYFITFLLYGLETVMSGYQQDKGCNRAAVACAGALCFSQRRPRLRGNRGGGGERVHSFDG